MGDGITYQQKLARWIANHLPGQIVYFAVVRAWDEATTGQWPGTETITVSTALSRLHVNMRDR